jgi:tetratricopeptide (TPR) repeat protein
MYSPWLPLIFVLACPLSFAFAVAQQPAGETPKPLNETKPAASGKAEPSDRYVPYEAQDVRAVFEVKKGTDGKAHASIRIGELRKLVDRLGEYARNHPVRFRSPAEKALAIKDAQAASKVLAPMLAGAQPDAKLPPNLLLAAGDLEAIAHNLDIEGSAERATAFYERLLKQDPEHALGNLNYGMFLAGTATRGKDAIPFLEKAAAAGQVLAHRGLGVVHLTLDDKTKALEHLRKWSAANPDDAETKEMIAAIESGAPIEHKRGPVPGDGK